MDNKKKICSRYSISLLVLAILFFTGATAYFFVCLNSHFEDSRIFSQGLRAKANVIEKSGPSYDEVVTITYTLTTYDGHSIISKDDLPINSTVRVGSSIEIAYDPTNPDKNFPVEQGVRPLWHIILFTIPIVIIGILFLVSWRSEVVKSKLR